MAAVKFRMPTEEEKEILRRNLVDPEGVAVTFRDKDTIRLLRHTTRDEIIIRRGGKEWS